jgi:hypothetical protein
MTEPTTCRYLISGRSAAACGVKGDPFDYQGYSDDPAHSFGFVVLGATIAVLITVLYTVGEGRGWWNPIKNWCVAAVLSLTNNQCNIQIEVAGHGKPLYCI